MEDAEKLNKFNLFVGRIYKTALERRRIGDLKSSGGDYAAACFTAIDAYTGFHPLLRNPIMSDISNRSAYRVTVARRPEHDRTFPFSQAGRTKLAAYIAELRAKGLKPQVAQGTDAWQVRVRRKGHPAQVTTFGSLEEADAFVKTIDAEQSRGLFRDYTAAANISFAALVQRYIDEECPRLKGGDTYAIILNAMLEDSVGALDQRIRVREAEAKACGRPMTKLRANRVPMGNLEWMQKPMTEIQAMDIEDFIQERLQYVAPPTVDRQLDLVRAVIKVATETWGYYVDRNPLQGVRLPKYFNERERRLSEDEEVRLLEAARQEDQLRSFDQQVKAAASNTVMQSKTLPTHYARNAASREAYESARAQVLQSGFQHVPVLEAFIRFQLATAARRGETLGLRWTDIDAKSQTALLPTTKNGRARRLALRIDVLELLQQLPRTSDRVFDLSIKALANAWRKMCDSSSIEDFRIHDLRHEAISRAAESGVFATVLDLQAFSGHRDLRSLTRYTHLQASAIAKKLESAEAARLAAHKGRLRLKSSEMNLLLTSAPSPTFRDTDVDLCTAPNVVQFPKHHSVAR